jgi:hypothetical protein
MHALSMERVATSATLGSFTLVPPFVPATGTQQFVLVSQAHALGASCTDSLTNVHSPGVRLRAPSGAFPAAGPVFVYCWD